MITSKVFAQTGSLKGIVIDETGQPAFDVTVFIPALKTGTVTELEGEYEVKNIPPGTYKIIFKGVGYSIDTVAGVVIKAGELTVLDKTINSTNSLVIDITEKKDEGSVVTAIEDTKNSDKVISVLSTEQIQKGQDRDAAEAIRRIPGVTLIDGRFIMVRGLSERYNSVWLNDAGAPSSETDSKAFSFDIIPSQCIDKIQVYKTSAPDLPADFAGGMAKIYTRTSATKKEFQVNLQGSYRPGSTFQNFNFTAGSPTDFLGFDNGYRKIPSIIPAYNINANPNLDRDAISKSFPNDWGVHTRTALPDLRLNIFYTNKFNIKKVQAGSTTNLNYANLNTIYKINRADWNDTVQVAGWADKQSSNTARLGLIQNFSFIFSKNFKLEFRNLFNQFGLQQNTIRTNSFSKGQDIKAYALLYQSRSIYSTQLTGTYSNDSSKTQYSWTLGYSYSNKNMPDFRRIFYSKIRGTDDSTYTAQVPAGTADPNKGGGRFYSKLNENVFSFNHGLSHKFGKIQLNVGNYIELKSRVVDQRAFGYTIFPSQMANSYYLKLPIEQIFADQNVGVPGGFKIDEITDKSYKYTAQNNLFATYVSVNAPIGKRIKLLAGVRGEYNIQSIQTYVSTAYINPSVKTFLLLPSLNLSYNFTEKSLLRAAYGETVNRPEFREWAPFSFYDFNFNATTYGSLYPSIINPGGKALEVCHIQNFDLRYERYPTPDEMFNIGVFYKEFKDPILQVVQSASDDSRAFTFTNGNSAYSMGAEIDVRKNLAFADNFFNTKFMSNLSLVMNASLIKSQVYNTNVINQSFRNPLQGQSPYIINSGLYYQDDLKGWQGSLLYNVFGPRIFLQGTNDYASYGEMPRNTVDLVVSKVVKKNVAVSLGVQDIFNQPVLIVQDTNQNGKFERKGDDKLILKYRKGSYFTAGIKMNF